MCSNCTFLPIWYSHLPFWKYYLAQMDMKGMLSTLVSFLHFIGIKIWILYHNSLWLFVNNQSQIWTLPTKTHIFLTKYVGIWHNWRLQGWGPGDLVRNYIATVWHSLKLLEIISSCTLGYPISGPIRLNNFSLRINLIACFRVGSQVFGPSLWQMVLVHMMAQMAQMVHWALGHCMVQGHLYFGPDHPTLSHSVWGLKTILGPKAAKNWLQSAISIQMCYFNSRRLYMGSGEQ